MRNKISSLSAGTKTLKRLLLLVAIFATISPLWNEVWAKSTFKQNVKVSGKWGKEGNIWYIYYGDCYASGGTLGDWNVQKWTSGDIFIYCPNMQSDAEMYYYAESSSAVFGLIDGSVTFYSKIDGNTMASVGPIFYTSRNWQNYHYVYSEENKNFHVSNSSTQLNYGWSSDDYPHVLGDKHIRVTIKLPKHIDFTDAATETHTLSSSFSNGTMSEEINLTPYLKEFIKSYYLDGTVSLAITGTDASMFSFSGNNTLLTPSGDTEVYANIPASGTFSGFTIDNLPDLNKTIVYTPTDFEQHSCTLKIVTNKGEKEFLIINAQVPEHFITQTGNAIKIGKFSKGNTTVKTVDFSNYIQSFRVFNNVVLTLHDASCGEFKFKGDDGVSASTTANLVTVATGSEADYSKSLNIGSIDSQTIMFTPDDNCDGLSGNPTCTLTISYNNGSYSNSVDITVEATADETFIFTTNGSWSEKSKWNKGELPGTDDDVSIQAPCTISSTDGTAECKSMEIVGNGTLTVTTSGVLVASGNLNNSLPEKLNIKADANGSGTVIFNNLCGSGPQATVDMYIPQTTDERVWRYMGSPVASGTVLTDGLQVFKWSEVIQNIYGASQNWTENGAGIEAWDGYAMSATRANGIATITGQLTNCDETYPLSATGTPWSDTYTNYTEDQLPDDYNPNKGNNLITNSYSAPIDISLMNPSDFTGADATIYFFKSATHSTWASAAISSGFSSQFQALPIKSTGAMGTGKIASGQAFFVKADQVGSSFKFKYSAVSNSASGAAYAPAKKEYFNVLQVFVEGTDSMGDMLWLMENENCSEKFDNGYDGRKILGTVGTPQLYATTEFGRTSVNVDQTLTGQYLGFMAGKNGVHYTISFNTDRLEGYESLYLYDTKENKYANIMKGESYTFTGLRSGEEKRFLIVGQRDDEDDMVVRTGDEQRIEVVGNRALVMGFDGSDAEVRVVDMQGKVVCTWSMKEGPWFELPDLPGGVYVISVEKCQTKFVK